MGKHKLENREMKVQACDEYLDRLNKSTKPPCDSLELYLSDGSVVVLYREVYEQLREELGERGVFEADLGILDEISKKLGWDCSLGAKIP